MNSDKFLCCNYYLDSLKRQLSILINKGNYCDELIHDHLRLAIIDICIIFGLDGNSPFPIVGIEGFLSKYQENLQDIRVMRNDLIAHSFDPSTANTNKKSNHDKVPELLKKYKDPMSGNFTSDLINLISNQ